MSVIIPVYNGAAEIGPCIEAVLAQTVPAPEREVIVVDNGSTDGTAGVVARYPVRLVHEDDQVGSYAARNRGIAAARGRILAFTDADCIPAPGWLAAALEAFEDPDTFVVGGEIEPAPPANEVERYLAERGFLSHRYTLEHPYRPYFQTANVFYRREVFDKVGVFASDLISGGDVDMSWRAQEAGMGPLRYVEAARVAHRHRADRRQMLRQRFKWGIGSGCLSRLYRDPMGGVRRRIEWNGYLRIAGAAVRWLGALPAALLRGAEGRRRLRWAGWELLGTLAWKAGYWMGWFRPRAVRNQRL